MDGSLGFELTETTIDRIHQAFAAGTLTARGLVNAYLKRIAAYDQLGPALNAIISLNPEALAEAERLDAIFKTSGPVGPLHGIPIVVKDQADVKGLPTTMGSVLFKGFMPDRDAFAVAKLRAAGAIILGKSTLGELGGGDTHGSLFGSTRNPFDIERTAGGSSGGSATCVSANFCTVAVAQEGFASIRRPSSWNGIVGMRPTQGLVSRGNVYAGWPSVSGSLGPMARTVSDAAKLLECMIGYDPADPVTARGYGRVTGSLSAGLKRDSLKGARIGILRESIGYASEPDSEDFKAVDVAFQRSIGELAAAGAMIVDPVVIPELKALLAKRAGDRATEEESFRNYFGPCRNAPFKTRDEAAASPLFAQVTRGSQDRWTRASAPGAYGEYLKAREDLMTRFLKLMADYQLDAIVHKAVEHSPTLIRDGIRPPYVDQKGAPHINTFLIYVPSIVVPAGFTAAGLPTGITFLGRPYDDAKMLSFAYAYEQSTQHRRMPMSVPPL